MDIKKCSLTLWLQTVILCELSKITALRIRVSFILGVNCFLYYYVAIKSSPVKLETFLWRTLYDHSHIAQSGYHLHSHLRLRKRCWVLPIILAMSDYPRWAPLLVGIPSNREWNFKENSLYPHPIPHGERQVDFRKSLLLNADFRDQCFLISKALHFRNLDMYAVSL